VAAVAAQLTSVEDRARHRRHGYSDRRRYPARNIASIDAALSATE